MNHIETLLAAFKWVELDQPSSQFKCKDTARCVYIAGTSKEIRQSLKVIWGLEHC